MNIAIYYPWVHIKSGVEKTILETIKNSNHKFTVFTNHLDLKHTFTEFKQVKVVQLKKVTVKRSLRSAFVAALTILFQKIDLKEFDLLLVHSEGLGDLILARNHNLPTYCYCHTPLRPVFDKEYKKRALAKRGWLQKSLYLLFEVVFKVVDKYLWKNYQHVFFNSQESLSRARSGKILHKNTRYEILNPGVDTTLIKPSWVYKKYFFVPGRIMWTKNIELAISGFEEFTKQNPKNKKYKLVISGHVDSKSQSYLKSLKRKAKSLNIVFVPNPTEKVFNNYYKNCYSVIATSFNEDWGIVPVEANAYGKAVIATNSGGFKESQKNGVTGYLVGLDKFEIAKKMNLLASNIRLTKKIGQNARKNSEKYNWIRFANKIDQVLENK